MKKLLLIGAVVAGAYLYFKSKQGTGKNTGVVPKGAKATGNTAFPSQPSQLWPWQPVVPPRVDNANQPWYNNSTQGMKGPADSYSGVTGVFSASSSLVHSLSDVWGVLPSASQAQDPNANLQSPSQTVSTVGTADDIPVGDPSQLPGQGGAQNTPIGAAIGAGAGVMGADSSSASDLGSSDDTSWSGGQATTDDLSWAGGGATNLT